MTVQDWWKAAGLVFEEEKRNLDAIDPDLTDPEEMMTAIRRTLQRLEQIGKPAIQ